jgi:GTP-binding protein Era
MPEGPSYFSEDVVTDQPMRVLAAEIIREKLLQKTRDELPFAVAVGIDSFKEEGRLARISATIYVEKDSQKAIVIGKHG